MWFLNIKYGIICKKTWPEGKKYMHPFWQKWYFYKVFLYITHVFKLFKKNTIKMLRDIESKYVLLFDSKMCKIFDVAVRLPRSEL